jgi:hypothetical protein
LEKYRLTSLATATTAASAERTSSMRAARVGPTRLQQGANGRWSLRWWVLLLAGVVLSLSTPMF